MSQWDKLLARLKTLDTDLRFEELEKILLRYGYNKTQSKRGSSHYIFRKGQSKIVIPKHKPILKVYIAMLSKRRKRNEKRSFLLHVTSLQN